MEGWALAGHPAVAGAAEEDAGSRLWPAPCRCSDATHRDRIPGTPSQAGDDISRTFERHADQYETIRDTRRKSICWMLRSAARYWLYREA
jgi:hypothetical protein